MTPTTLFSGAATGGTTGSTTSTSSNGGSATRSGSGDSTRFDQMLKGSDASTSSRSAAKRDASAGSSKAKETDAHGSSAGSTAGKPRSQDAASSSEATETTGSDAAAQAEDHPAAQDDTPAETADDAAPWPPVGLAGLALSAAVPVTPVATAAPANDDAPLAGATPALPAQTAAAGLPATGPTLPAVPATAQAGASAPVVAAGDDDALPLQVLAQVAAADPTAGGDDGVDLAAPTTPTLQGLGFSHELKGVLATASAMAVDPTPTPVLGDDGFDQAIGARVGWMADQKIGHAHIRISPDDLGTVDVRLQLDGDRIHASFASPHVDVRQALESSLPRLRDMLGEQGFQLAHADVGQQPAGNRGEDGQGGAGTGRGGDGEPSLAETTVSASQLIRQRGLLDTYA